MKEGVLTPHSANKRQEEFTNVFFQANIIITHAVHSKDRVNRWEKKRRFFS